MKFDNQVIQSVYDFICSMENAKVGTTETSVCFGKGAVYGKIMFYESGVLELTVQLVENEERLFYLHLEVDNMATVLTNLTTFFSYLKDSCKKETYEPDYSVLNNKKILFSCTSGLTTSYLSYLFYENCVKNGIEVTTDAVAVSTLDEVIDNYDYVLLAPQISHEFTSLQKKYGSKVQMINGKDFATYDIKNIIYKLGELYELTK